LEDSGISITDEHMQEMITRTKDYTIFILKATPKIKEPGADK
jgi:hypothetical protein